MAISFVLSVVSSIEQVQEMELSNEEITKFICTIVSYGATFCCRFYFDFYKLLILTSKSAQHSLENVERV